MAPVRACIQRRSSGATRCQVGRSRWVRSQPPADCSASTPAYVVPGVIRMPSDHAASGASCDCTQASRRTTSAPCANPADDIRWVASRRRCTRARGWPLIAPSSHRSPTRRHATSAAPDRPGDPPRRPPTPVPVGRTDDTGIDRVGTPVDRSARRGTISPSSWWTRRRLRCMRTRRRRNARLSHHPVVHCEALGKWQWSCGCGARGSSFPSGWHGALTAALVHQSQVPGE